MWMSTLYMENMMNSMMKMIMEKDADDVVLNGFKKNTWMIRFSKNNLDITRFHDEAWIDVYIGYRKRKLFFGINEMDEEKVRSTIDKMIQSSNYLPPYPGYVSLPPTSYNYVIVPDTYVDNINFEELSERLMESIKLGLKLKLTDISGSLLISKIKHIIYTSTGNKGEYKRSNSNLNMRLFKRKNVSYTVNTEVVDPHKIDFEDLVASGASRLKKVGKVNKVESGRYNVLLSPIVMGNLFNYIGRGLSAYSVLIHNSPFIGRLDKKVMDERISLTDRPMMPNNPGACSFDMEGVPAKDLYLIEDGVLKNYIHNLSTAYKFETKPSGHAGLVFPLPHSLILDSEKTTSLDDLLLEVKDGIYITNVWYTRFQNYISGDFSTLQRDAGFVIKDGEFANVVTGARISENIIGMLNKIIGIANDKIWVKWWDYEIPSLMPHVAFKDINITTSF